MHTVDSLKVSYFQESLLQWYYKNGREFIWRESTASNYIRILSEVFLQRTKAETVANFIPSFIIKYPSWKAIAEANLDEIKESIKPLGLYNQRAPRLHKLAIEMERKLHNPPTARAEIEEMPMMGQYIANAYELFILNKAALS